MNADFCTHKQRQQRIDFSYLICYVKKPFATNFLWTPKVSLHNYKVICIWTPHFLQPIM